MFINLYQVSGDPDNPGPITHDWEVWVKNPNEHKIENFLEKVRSNSRPGDAVDAGDAADSVDAVDR